MKEGHLQIIFLNILAVFFAVALIGAALFWGPAFSTYKGVASASTNLNSTTEWSREGGEGIAFPACGSSGVSTSCDGSTATAIIGVPSAPAGTEGCEAFLHFNQSNFFERPACGSSVTKSDLTPNTLYPCGVRIDYGEPTFDEDGTVIPVSDSFSCSFTTPNCAPPPPPVSPIFEIDKIIITPEDPIEITWEGLGGSTSSSGINFSTGGAVSGSTSVSPTITTAFTLLCDNGGEETIIVTVIDPIISITADPLLLQSGGTTAVSWTASSANSCVVSEDNPAITDSWTGLSGTEMSGAIEEETVYTLTCQTDAGVVSQSVTVRLVPVFQEF